MSALQTHDADNRMHSESTASPQLLRVQTPTAVSTPYPTEQFMVANYYIGQAYARQKQQFKGKGREQLRVKQRNLLM